MLQAYLLFTILYFQVRIVCSAEAAPEELFHINDNEDVGLTDTQRILMDDLKVSHGHEAAAANVFSGSEEVFAYNRTISRLCEMQTATYWAYRKPSSVD